MTLKASAVHRCWGAVLNNGVHWALTGSSQQKGGQQPASEARSHQSGRMDRPGAAAQLAVGVTREGAISTRKRPHTAFTPGTASVSFTLSTAHTAHTPCPALPCHVPISYVPPCTAAFTHSARTSVYLPPTMPALFMGSPQKPGFITVMCLMLVGTTWFLFCFCQLSNLSSLFQ